MSSTLLRTAVMAGALAVAHQGQAVGQQLRLSDESLRSRAESRMKSLLSGLAEEQMQYRRRHHRYSSSAFAIYPDENRLTIISSSRSGWSAVAVDSLAPGLRCFYRTGDAPPLAMEQDRKDRPFCAGTPDSLLRDPPAIDTRFVYLGDDAEPPQQRNCSEYATRIAHARRPEGRRSQDQRSVLQVVVDTTGQVEAAGLTIIEATGVLVAMDHLFLLANCGFLPGRIGGQPIRVTVQQRFNIR